MPAVDVVCDMHCVTHWSRLDNVFTGVSTKAIIERARPRPEARFVMCHSEAASPSTCRWTNSRETIACWRISGRARS
jgi:DMSO/TMAO reductase YedYZ molybdopterin-dependent catalytic subunit